ncbi:MAG TPA: hypothetical protein VHB21_14485 [Minicystis sp.]|nr:hypothetical protein [Minicystis sp.]
MSPKKVLLLEFNEITRTVIDPLLAAGRLPTFARLFEEGTSATPVSVDAPPHLDPWVTWVTLHTGVDRSVHGATVLEQDASTLRAKRTWDYAADAGLGVGVFGSISAFPPRPVPGFMVPGPFAPSDETYPAYARPVQVLNRRYTQEHHKQAAPASPLDTARLGVDLLRLGLKPATCAEIARQLVRERTTPGAHYRRVALQPLVNYDFFETLYRRYAPAYATWHTNHAAHYMHHYWRAYDDTGFLAKSPADEKKKYGEAVPYGYEVCDRLLARFLRLVDDDTVIVLASSMGQKPYVAELFPEGRVVVRFRDVRRVLDLVGAEGVTEIVPVMAPQVNVRIPDAGARARARGLLERAEAHGGTRPQAFAVSETGEILTVTPLGHANLDRPVRYRFPGAPGDREDGYALEELFVADTPTAKQGMHDPRGVLLVYGKGIRRGVTIDDTTNLDVAPTILTLLGLPVPAVMKGRPLAEAWEAPARPREAATALA